MYSRFMRVFVLMALFSCHSSTTVEEQEPEVITATTVVGISVEPMAEYVDLNATSAYQRQSIIKASSNGYITAANIQAGKMVSRGQIVFSEITKEAKAIGNTINQLDSTFKFSGVIAVKSGTAGFVSEVNHSVGDYVQEGEQLAVVSDITTFVFVLNLPYELRPYVIGKKSVELNLPDGQNVVGHILSTMPVVDSTAQTQSVIIGVNEKNLPINLIAKVRVNKIERPSAVSLPKQAVLSDETQKNFWVMKVVDSTTAVKVPIKKGIETNERVEILSPVFSSADRFMLTGNYGLEDTARIKIIKE